MFSVLERWNGFFGVVAVSLAICVISSFCIAQSVDGGEYVIEDLSEIKAYTNISAADARTWRDSGSDILFLDVRELSEWINNGHIPDAILMPWNSGYLQAHHTELPDKPIVVYCGVGARGALASAFLDANGHTNIYNIIGGLASWQNLPDATGVSIEIYDFESGAEDWNFEGTVAPYNTPASSCESGQLGLSAQGCCNCFSYWYSPEIFLNVRKYYRAKWSVSCDTTEQDDAVQFRLRVNQLGTWAAWERVVNSNLGNAPCSSVPKDYSLLFTPLLLDCGCSETLVVMNFDIMCFDPLDDCNSWIALEEVELEQVSLFTSNDLTNYSFDTSADGWQFACSIPGFDTPVTSVENGYIGLSPNNSFNCFSYWYSPDVTVAANKMYRAIWTVGSSATAINDAVQFRLRANQKGSWSSWGHIVNSSLDVAPDASGPRTYQVFMDPAVTGTVDDKMVFSFDIMSFDAGDDLNSTIYLDTFQMEDVVVQP